MGSPSLTFHQKRTRKIEAMSRAIFCLVFVAIVASIGQRRVIEKRSPGVGADLAAKIDKAVDLKAIGGHIDKAIDKIEDFGSDAIDWTKGAANTVGDFFGGLGRKKRSPGVADLAGKLDEAVDLKAIGGHIDDAIDDIKDFANSDGVRRVGNKIADAASDVGDAIGDFFG